MVIIISERISLYLLAQFIKEALFYLQDNVNLKVGQDSQILDESLENFKHPRADLNTSQKIAKTGETVPIVFGKRTNNMGGVWIQPSLIKAGTENFVQKLLYVISQGEIVSSPTKSRAYTGIRRLSFLDDTTVSVSNIYATPATLTTTPSSCPIQGQVYLWK